MNEDYDLTARELFDSLLSKSFEKYEEEDENPGAYYIPPLEGISREELPLLEEEDRDILMHRDAHFSKNFDLMIEHYEDEGIGAVLDIEPSRIRALMHLEEQLGQNLAPYLVQGVDAEKIAQSLKLYRALRERIEHKKKAPLVGAIAELILSEEEADAAAKKAASFGPKLIPYLLQLLQTTILYDPLFPGYGTAPIRACLTLGKLQAKEAIKLLFGMIGTENFDTESAAISALCQIGKPAFDFVIEQLAARPITKNNERAAIVSSSLEMNDQLASEIVAQLEDRDVQKIQSLATYLVLALPEVPEHLQERYKKLIPLMPDSIREEMNKSC